MCNPGNTKIHFDMSSTVAFWYPMSMKIQPFHTRGLRMVGIWAGLSGAVVPQSQAELWVPAAPGAAPAVAAHLEQQPAAGRALPRCRMPYKGLGLCPAVLRPCLLWSGKGNPCAPEPPGVTGGAGTAPALLGHRGCCTPQSSPSHTTTQSNQKYFFFNQTNHFCLCQKQHSFIISFLLPV